MNFSQSYLAAILLIAVICSYASGRQGKQSVSYSGYALYRCLPQTQHQVEKLRSLMHHKKTDGIEFWIEPTFVNRTVDIMVSPEDESDLRDEFRALRIPVKKIMDDVGYTIKRNSRTPSHREFDPTTYRDGSNASDATQEYLSTGAFYTKYPPLKAIEAKLHELAARDSRITFEKAGLTQQRRPIYVAKVSSDPSANKPVIFIDAGHHAREWISHITSLYLLESLVNDDMPRHNVNNPYRDTTTDNRSTYESKDLFRASQATPDFNMIEAQQKYYKPLDSSFLEEYDFWFVPVVNPDGYHHSHVVDRLWRKNRSSGRFCTGVDINRNYPFHWRELGASSNPCDETYAGRKESSEAETNAIVNLLEPNQDRILAYFTLHAYSQLMLAPWGYARLKPPNYNELERVSRAGRKAIYSLRRTVFEFGTSSIVLYPAAGGSDDFAMGKAGIQWSYTIELQDAGRYGFLLPPREIIPSAHEASLGIAAMLEAISGKQQLVDLYLPQSDES